MKRLITLLILLFLATAAQAAEYYQPLKSYRAMAMGNTGVSSANDAYSLSYNPAVLANVQGWWVDYGAWTVEASDGVGVLDVLPNMLSIQYPYINEDGLTEASRTSFLEKTDPHMRANAGINFAANITKSGFAMGANYLREVVIQGLDDNATLFQRNDRIVQYGMSIPLFSGQLVMGLGARNIQRRDATSDAATGVPSFGEYESGTSGDVGFIWRMGGAARMTWGLVAQNIGGLDIGSTVDAEPQETHFGVSMDLDIGLVKLIPAIDVRGIQTDRLRSNRVHAGAELGFFSNDTGGSWVTVRAGSNEGYATAGAELNFFNRAMILGGARYYEELGDGTTKVQSPLRQMLYFSLGF